MMVNSEFSLPDGFVYLKSIDDTITESIRYFYGQNFVGRQIPGYHQPRAILTLDAANGLAEVSKDVKADGYGIVVYDAYRPQKAVSYFIEWSQDHGDNQMQPLYYPYLDKSKVFDSGYLAKKSGHSRGSTVDLTLIQLGQKLEINSKIIVRTLSDGREVLYIDDNTLDMYTSFDLMDEASNHDSKIIPEEYLFRRNYLRTKMLKHGFKDYSVEWWHYTLSNEPHKDTYFDFDIA